MKKIGFDNDSNDKEITKSRLIITKASKITLANLLSVINGYEFTRGDVMNNFINFDDFDRESVEEAIEIGINEKNKFYSEDFEINLIKNLEFYF